MDTRALVLEKYKSRKAELLFLRFHSDLNSLLEMSEEMSENYYTTDYLLKGNEESIYSKFTLVSCLTIDSTLDSSIA